MNQLVSERHSFRVNPFGVEFVVYGHPEPGGSKTVGRRRDGGTFVRDDNREVYAWKEEIQIVAGTLMRRRELFSGALILYADFYQKRPKWHWGRRGNVVPRAPRFPVGKPDATKLLRPLEDALTGIIWNDDAQIVEQHVRKLYDEDERVEVRVLLKLR